MSEFPHLALLLCRAPFREESGLLMLMYLQATEVLDCNHDIFKSQSCSTRPKPPYGRQTLSRGQKWFLRPYFPLIRGMFLLRSGLRFSFRALEVPDPRVRKRPLSLTNMGFSSLSVRALPVH